MMGGMMGGMGGMGGGEPPPPIPGVQSDVVFIQCAACRATIRRSAFTVKQLRENMASLGRSFDFGEDAISEALTNLCDTSKPQGEWLADYDIVESDTATLQLKRMNVPGECGVECKTASMACQATLDAIEDLDSLVVPLYKGEKTGKELELLACGAAGAPGWTHSLPGACSQPQPKVPEDRPPGPPYEPKAKPPPPFEMPPEVKKKKKKKKAKKAAPKDEP